MASKWSEEQKQNQKEIKRKLAGELIHLSRRFVGYDDNNEPLFKSVTLKKPPKEIRRIELQHNNSKRRRMQKMYNIA